MRAGERLSQTGGEREAIGFVGSLGMIRGVIERAQASMSVTVSGRLANALRSIPQNWWNGAEKPS